MLERKRNIVGKVRSDPKISIPKLTQEVSQYVLKQFTLHLKNLQLEELDSFSLLMEYLTIQFNLTFLSKKIW